MDGINGITVICIPNCYCQFFFLSINVSAFVDYHGLVLFCFGLFNIRKRQRLFAGDVGSISMAFF
jgi:hypothetical protein